jgi:subtilisin family serine protease
MWHRITDLDRPRRRHATALFVWCTLTVIVTGVQARASSSFAPIEREPARTAATLAELEIDTDDAASRKVWVYLTDKGITDEAAYRQRLRELGTSLDEHSAARRLKALGPDLVDSHDIPVHPDYVERLQRLGASIVHRSRWLNAVSVRAPLPVLRTIGRLSFVRKLELVRSGQSRRATPSLARRTVDAPDSQSLLEYGQSFAQLDEIGIVAVHDLGLSGAGVRIAMLDTGYRRDHPAFDRVISEGRLIAQWDFINDDPETQNEPGDPEGQDFHGTTTWSAVGGFTEGELIGSAYGAEFLLAKTEDTSGEDPIEEDNWVAAAEWSDALGADIISSSLSYIAWYTYPDMNGNTAPTTIASDIAAARGIVVCVAAGNWGTQDWYYIGAPADADSVVAVGGTEPDGSMWLDSSHGPTYDGRTKPEVVARGSLVWAATIPGGHGGPDLYRNFDGTSMSCPLVAGAAALLLEARPEWTPMMVREALMMTADNAQTPDNHRGWGRIDALAALDFSTGVPPAGPDLATVAAPRLRIAPNPFRSATRIDITLPVTAGGPGLVEVFAPTGRQVRRLELNGLGSPIMWDGRGDGGRRLPSGIYLVLVSGDGWRVTRRVAMVR